jgi:hypothetical protein
MLQAPGFTATEMVPLPSLLQIRGDTQDRGHCPWIVHCRM